MNKVTTCLLNFLLILSASSFSHDRDIPWLVSWPFFQNAQAPHGVIEGYGDWCVASEGLHPGIDLYSGSVMDSLLNPFDQINHFNAVSQQIFRR